jgi:cell division protein FtsQ
MPGNNKYTFKKFLVIAVWILLGSGTVMLLIAAITKKDNEKITGVEIHISGVQNNYFIDKKDVLELLEKVNKKKLDKAVVSSLDLAAMERRLESDQWVRKAEIFFDNNNVLQVKISEREPVARIFTTSGASFYIDSSLTRLPLSDKFSARLPVFTNFPTEVKALKKQDSLLLNEIKVMSEYIGSRSFWMAQIDQIDIASDNTFVLVPKLGNQTILFGNAYDCEEKFNKLLAFYKQVQTKIGWNRYSMIDVKFKNQVVAVKRDAAEIRSDSLRSVQIMKNIIAEAQRNTDDSTRIQLSQPDGNNDKINAAPLSKDIRDETIEQPESVETTPNENKAAAPIKAADDGQKPDLKKQVSNEKRPMARSSSNDKPHSQSSKTVKKDAIDRKETKERVPEMKQVPKAVMPSKSDY